MPLTVTLFCSEMDGRRSSGRRLVERQSTVRDSEARPHAALVHDLSLDGCSIVAGMPLAVGDSIAIGLPGVGRRNAAVVQVQSGRYGCRFLTPLGQDALDTAFANDPVIYGGFAPQPAALDLSIEPVLEKWHPAARVAITLASATLLWSGILRMI